MSGARYYSETPIVQPRATMGPKLRQFHRWVAALFTLTVAANFAAMAFGPPPAWVTYAPLLPLLLLFLTGAYLFVQPYLRRP